MRFNLTVEWYNSIKKRIHTVLWKSNGVNNSVFVAFLKDDNDQPCRY